MRDNREPRTTEKAPKELRLKTSHRPVRAVTPPTEALRATSLQTAKGRAR